MGTGERNKSVFSSPRSYDQGLVVWRSLVIIQANGQHDKKVPERMIEKKTVEDSRVETRIPAVKQLGLCK